MSHYHCVVWIDHREAHVIEFNPDEAEASVVHPKARHEHLHHKQGVTGSGRTPEDHAYYQAVAEAITGAGEILIVGPSTAKLELFKHLQAHASAIAARVVSVETVDHPSDAQLVALLDTLPPRTTFVSQTQTSGPAFTLGNTAALTSIPAIACRSSGAGPEIVTSATLTTWPPIVSNAPGPSLATVHHVLCCSNLSRSFR